MSKRDPEDRVPTPPAGVQEAASEYIDKAEAYRRYVQEGLDDIAAGRTRPWSEVKAELRARFGNPED